MKTNLKSHIEKPRESSWRSMSLSPRGFSYGDEVNKMPAKGTKWTEKARESYRKGFLKRDYRGENNPKWRGGRQDNREDGRIIVYAPDNPGANLYGGTHILEYRLIAERKIGRYLRSDEIVHHVNGDVSDNSPGNIEVMTQSEHAKLENYRRDKITGRYLTKREVLCG